jgi:transcriptional regulator with XRE-family HTH domain
MTQTSNEAGRRVRELRRQHGMTLERLAAAIGTSIPVLSRKERGEQPFERKDVRALIEQFELAPHEAHELWTGAGFVPEVSPPISHASNSYEFAEALLLRVPYPACVLSFLGYLLAWNQEFEMLWHPSRLALKPLHALDLLLSADVAPEMAEAWEHTTRQILGLFYQRLVRRAHEPPTKRLLASLSARYGARFDAPWQAYQQGEATPPTGAAEVLLVSQHSPWGPLTFLALRGLASTPRNDELITLVPFGAESHERYQQARATVSVGRLYVHL